MPIYALFSLCLVSYCLPSYFSLYRNRLERRCIRIVYRCAFVVLLQFCLCLVFGLMVVVLLIILMGSSLCGSVSHCSTIIITLSLSLLLSVLVVHLFVQTRPIDHTESIEMQRMSLTHSVMVRVNKLRLQLELRINERISIQNIKKEDI